METGEKPLTYEQIMAPTTRGHDASCALMQAWVDAHPTDPRVPRALVWMAQLRVADHNRALAQPMFLRVYKDYPGTEWALHSLKGLADLDLESRRYGDAIAKFDTLASSSIPFFHYVGYMAGRRAREERFRLTLTLSLITAFLVLWGLRLWRGKLPRALWPPPVEVLYPLPILLLMAAASFGQPAEEARGVRMIALGAVMMLWLNGAYLRARPPKGVWQVVHGAMGLGQAVALLYVAVILSGLWDKFHDTLVMGAE
jgi:hypothetical protein